MGPFEGCGTLRRVLRIDHAVYAVRDLDAAAERFRRELGLDSTEGGHHGRWGTANRIVPVNPNETEVLDERAYPSLLDVPAEIPIEIVDVFRRAEETPSVAEQAVRRGAKVLWLQQGIVNEDARRIAEEAGLTVIMGVCIRTTIGRLEATR